MSSSRTVVIASFGESGAGRIAPGVLILKKPMIVGQNRYRRSGPVPRASMSSRTTRCSARPR